MPDNGGEQGRGNTRLADRIAVLEGPSSRDSFTLWTAAKVFVLAAMIVWINRPQFPVLWRTWIHDPNWSHGFLIPLFSAFLIYSRFDEILAAKRKVCWWALPVVVAAAVLQVIGYKMQIPWPCQVSMVVLVASLVLFLAGWRMFKLLWLPILFLVFAMPVSQSVYNSVAVRLQDVAAVCSAWVLRVFNVDVDVRGSTLFVVNNKGVEIPLSVEEACSGMRLLMAFLALSVAMAYIAARPIWQRVVLVLMGVPVAIASNVLRVTITCTMYIVGWEEMGKDFMHEFTGMLMLVPAALMLWLVGLLLQKLFVEEDEPEDDAAEQAVSAGAGANDD